MKRETSEKAEAEEKCYLTQVKFRLFIFFFLKMTEKQKTDQKYRNELFFTVL